MPEPVVVPEEVPSDIDRLIKEFMKIPDFIRYPLPEWIYKKYNLKKPQPAEISEVVSYTPPPHESLNKTGQVEVLPIAEGGVREVPTGVVAPSEVTVIRDESVEAPTHKIEDIIEQFIQVNKEPEALPSCKKVLDYQHLGYEDFEHLEYQHVNHGEE